jgi:squalene cyclase
MELLIKSGYQYDPRIEKGFQWLLSQRQDDGGWAIPLRTMKITYSDALKMKEVLPGDRTKPFSHLITGMALRAFAAHPQYRKAPEAHHAGKLLMSRFFQRDKYADRQDKKYWESTGFPFWFTNIVAALDSLYYLGFGVENPPIQLALEWLAEKQKEEGTFDIKLLMTRDKDLKLWVTLAICRIFKSYYSPNPYNL